MENLAHIGGTLLDFRITFGYLGVEGQYRGKSSSMQVRDLQRYKASLRLNKTQTSVLVGSLLGDGTLRIGDRAFNANFKVEQGLRQKDYVFWKYRVFKKWVITPPKISYRYNNIGLPYAKSWWFRTLRHPEMTKFRKVFYPGGSKAVPANLADWLDELALAVWVMDDGSLNQNKMDISTYSFGRDEISLLQEILYERFSLRSNFYRDRNKGLRMIFLIKPFVHPCLAYKIAVTP